MSGQLPESERDEIKTKFEKFINVFRDAWIHETIAQYFGGELNRLGDGEIKAAYEKYRNACEDDGRTICTSEAFLAGINYQKSIKNR